MNKYELALVVSAKLEDEEREAISQGGVGTVLFSRFFEEGEWVWYK